MAIIKKLTPEQKETKVALQLRTLKLYQEKRNLERKQLGLDNRIEHLERQIANIGGPGLELDEIFKKNYNGEDNKSD